jgi:tetratricopeptide (TPR) repeat protein
VRRGRAGFAALGLVLVATTVRAVDPPGTPRSQHALAVCLEARASTAADRDVRLERAVKIAEEAVTADDRDPLAHFALFCALGQKARAAGASLQSLTALRRMRREVDRALELEPEYVDAMVGKGALLVNLPALLGGSRKEGEALLRRALALDPDLFGARVELARALDARGERKQARAEAQGALAVAERRGDAADIVTARDLLNQLVE